MAREELKPIVRIEDFEAKLRRVAEDLAESGRQAGESARSRLGDQVVFRSKPTPKHAEEFLAEARRVLEEDIAIAPEVVGDPELGEDPIRPTERDLEVAKRALARLKVVELQRLAVSIDLDSRGGQAELVDRIAREYQDDPAEVARLVLEFEEATPDRGLVDRLYAIRSRIADLEQAAEGFRGLSGRYIRIGIARWFVFTQARIDDDGLWLAGRYRSYSAEAKREGEAFEIVSVPTDAPISARVRPEQHLIEIRGRGEAESRAIIRALEWGTSLRHAETLPLNVSVERGRLMAWDPRSVFMLHFLDRRLPDTGIEIINLTSARFETAAADQRVSRRPAVRAVALHGQHLLSSRAACELLVEGRGLVELSFEVRFRPSPDVTFYFPVRITLGSDHVSFLTGFGQHAPETAAQLHRDVVGRLRRALDVGTKPDDRLEALAASIHARAEADEPVREADIFAPPADWLDEVEEEVEAT